MKFKRVTFACWGLSSLILVAAAAGATAGEPASAGSPAANADPPDPRHSARPWFPVTELGVTFRLNPTKKGENELGEFERKDQVRITADVGEMKNLNQSEAVGGSVFAVGHGDGGSLGLRGRYRRWLTPEQSIDYSLGLSLLNTSEFDNSLSFAPVVGVTYSFRDLLLVNAQAEVTRYEHEGTDVAFCAGAALGSKPGAIGGVLLVVGGAVGIAIAVATMEGL